MSTYIRPQERYTQSPESDQRSLGDLFSDLSQKASLLARQEVQLAKVELQQKAKEAGSEIAIIAVGGVLGNAALLAFVTAAILGLTRFMDAWLAALLVGAFVGIAAALLVWKGVAALREINPTPEQTLVTLKEDKEWLTRQLNQ